MATQMQQADGKNSGGQGHQPILNKATKKKVLAYFLLPGIIPEIKELGRTKFGYLAYLIALIYQIVRILPKSHPYTRPNNIGKFGILDVIRTAANHIKADRDHIDQIVVFVAILAGLVLMIFQVISFIFFLFVGNAWAGPGVPAESDSLFITLNPDTDIAFYMIREVFGLPTMFGTLETQTGLHLALHQLVTFYNLAMLFVAVLIFLYYVVVVVGETAQTGVPFGQRFSKIYAPFRLVIAVGLLVPMNYGFNGSQYIAFYAAKLGSSLATNGWIRFNTALAGLNPLGADNQSLIAEPNTPDVRGLVEFMSVIVSCREAYANGPHKRVIVPYYVNSGGNAIENVDASVKTAFDESFAKGHFSLYFGVTNTGDKNYAGNSTPFCGEVKIATQVQDQRSINAVAAAGPQRIQEYYLALIYLLWQHPVLKEIGTRIANGQDQTKPACEGATVGDCAVRYVPPIELQERIVGFADLFIRQINRAVYNALRGQVNFEMTDEILLTGWGGAGIWYNKIAQANGAMVSATMALPNLEKRPIVMEKVGEEKQKGDGAYIDCEAYSPNLANNKQVRQKAGETDSYYASVTNETYRYWRCDREESSANFLWDSISAVFGLNGLFNLRENRDKTGVETGEIRVHVHPLAKLSTVGKGLVDSAVANMGLAMASSFGGGMLGTLSPHIGSGLQAASSMFVSIATIGLSIGFILYYVLPFLPFMYFFFAVGGWVKGLFEAMVGVPLWALAHLRIDGDGLPGKSAMNGYFLIFEIFLRPILTVFGLIGGLAIFTAMATILDDIFDLAVNNVTGADLIEGKVTNGTNVDNKEFGRNLIDQFFFTIVYAIILYMMALSSFKMITNVPNNILRWIGQSVSTFNDNAQDPAAGLTQYAALGGARIGGQLMGGMTQLSKGAGSFVDDAMQTGQGGVSKGGAGQS